MVSAEFEVSAPGKLILYGEHSVVYEKTAVAGALDLRTVLEFKELPPDNPMIHLCSPNIHLDAYIPLLQVLEYLSTKKAPKFNFDTQDEFYEYVKVFVQKLEIKTDQHKMALEAAIFLLFAIHQAEQLIIKPFQVIIKSALAISAGLGSSASFAVCTTTAFLYWASLQKNDKMQLNMETLSRISQYALGSEKIMHGTPSGVDNSVCTYGSVIEFKKGVKLTPISGIKPMRVLLVDSKVSRSTKNLVNKAATLRHQFPTIFDMILEAMENVALTALVVLKQIRDFNGADEKKSINDSYQQLMALTHVNQGLLSAFQVSHVTLDEICAEAKKLNLAAKLTGAGGGGYAFVLLPPDTSDEVILLLKNNLIDRGYTATMTTLGGAGVQIHEQNV